MFGLNRNCIQNVNEINMKILNYGDFVHYTLAINCVMVYMNLNEVESI